MEKPKASLKSILTDCAWDAFCISSFIGIWPRYIEPNLLDTPAVSFHFPHLKFDTLKVLHFSDLHLNDKTPLRFLKKIINKKTAFDPDFSFFTGDFFCKNNFIRQNVLVDFFSQMGGKKGSYCCFGNHDYDPYVSLCDGKVTAKKHQTPPLITGFKKIFKREKPTPNPYIDPSLKPKIAEPILDLLRKTPFLPLHNTKVSIQHEDLTIHLVGLGDYWSTHFKPKESLFNKNLDDLSITLSHNPDSFPDLKHYPIDLILSGHTHGRQVNLPFIGKKLTPVVNDRWARGHFREGSTSMYVNRGLGGQARFRWFSKPECTFITLTGNQSR